jgi:t-SNARE complex subunit (syntaxin)
MLNKFFILFLLQIVADTLEAQLALSNVKARHEELLNVERSVQEIRDIFVQMATLVETQVRQECRFDMYFYTLQ